jgi:hypothetical protein
MRYIIEEIVMADLREQISRVADRLAGKLPVSPEAAKQCATALRTVETRLLAPGISQYDEFPAEDANDPQTIPRSELVKQARSSGFTKEHVLGQPVKELRKMVAALPPPPPPVKPRTKLKLVLR